MSDEGRSRPQTALRDAIIRRMYFEDKINVKEIRLRLSLDNEWIVYRAIGKDRRKQPRIANCTCETCAAHRRQNIENAKMCQKVPKTSLGQKTDST